uniref:Uncharacterized protein n=1 Tax=Steinernema glaseri TaxID=37863 RepID=A0A1I7YKF8_9BILA
MLLASSVLLLLLAFSSGSPPLFVGISPSCHLFVGAPPDAPSDSSKCAQKRAVVYRIDGGKEALVGIADVVNNRIRLQILHFASIDLLQLKTSRHMWTNATVRHHFSAELDYGFAADPLVFSDGEKLFVFGRDDSSGAARLFRFKVVQGSAFSLELRQDPLHVLIDGGGETFSPVRVDYRSTRAFRLHVAPSTALDFDGAFFRRVNVSAPECQCEVCFRGICTEGAASPVDSTTTAALARKAVLYESRRRHLRMAFPHVRRPRYRYKRFRSGWLLANGLLSGGVFLGLGVHFAALRWSRGRIIA